METPVPAERAAGDRLSLLGGVAVAVVYPAARAAVQLAGAPLGGRIVIAAAPVVLFLPWVGVCVRSARRLGDELERQLQLEALAFAFPCVFALLMGFGLLERVVNLPPEDPSYRHVWAMCPLFSFVGLFLARRRYA